MAECDFCYFVSYVIELMQYALLGCLGTVPYVMFLFYISRGGSRRVFVT